MQELFDKIKNVKAKAMHAELVVQGITHIFAETRLRHAVCGVWFPLLFCLIVILW